MSELVSWWLLVEALGVVGLPLTVTVFSRLPDRGWSATKALTLLAFGWLIWFPLTIITALPFSRAWIIGTLLVFALANAAMLRAPSVRLALTKFIQTQRGYIVASEIVFAGAFGLMAWVRSFTPEVVDTEKFMDVAFLSSIWRAPHLPPPDPWLSGETINYYYFGHYLMALLAKALGTQPGTAFNLAIALIFALTTVVVFGLATNIVAAMRRTREASLLRYIPAGLASVFFVLIAGNLAGAQQWWKQATQLAGGVGAQLANPWAFWLRRDLWPQYNWWAPSRVVGAGDTINEFPAFSFILADLHAHVLALPFAALAILVALNLLLGEGEGLAAFGAPRWRFLTLGVFALCLGALFAINGWDFPTYCGTCGRSRSSSSSGSPMAGGSRGCSRSMSSASSSSSADLPSRSICRSIAASHRPRRASASCQAMSARPSATSSPSMGSSPSSWSRMEFSSARGHWRMCWRSARRRQTMSHFPIAG